jgi:large subunit ribosomal protein L11
VLRTSPPVGPALGLLGLISWSSVSNLMLELKINPAKYAQYKLLCIKTNHLILLLKLLQRQFSYWAAKLKSGSGEPNRKKVASVTWMLSKLAEDKMVD